MYLYQCLPFVLINSIKVSKDSNEYFKAIKDRPADCSTARLSAKWAKLNPFSTNCPGDQAQIETQT